MSTERTISEVRKNGAEPEGLKAFETHDFYLACFLKCMGYELVDLRPEGRRRVFVFRDRPKRRGDVMAYFGNNGSVRPLKFTSTIKNMKALIHNG